MMLFDRESTLHSGSCSNRHRMMTLSIWSIVYSNKYIKKGLKNCVFLVTLTFSTKVNIMFISHSEKPHSSLQKLGGPFFTGIC